MNEPFDPYYQWLAIPPDEQPPTFYRLLGLREGEDNHEAISHASDQRLIFLRRYLHGQFHAATLKLSLEVEAACQVLLSPEKKAEYDRFLSQQRQALATYTPAGRPPEAMPIPVANPPALPSRSLSSDANPPTVLPATRFERSRPAAQPDFLKGLALLLQIIAGAVLGIGCALLIVKYIRPDTFSRAEAKDIAKTPSQTQEQVAQVHQPAPTTTPSSPPESTPLTGKVEMELDVPTSSPQAFSAPKTQPTNKVPLGNAEPVPPRVMPSPPPNVSLSLPNEPTVPAPSTPIIEPASPTIPRYVKLPVALDTQETFLVPLPKPLPTVSLQGDFSSANLVEGSRLVLEEITANDIPKWKVRFLTGSDDGAFRTDLATVFLKDDGLHFRWEPAALTASAPRAQVANGLLVVRLENAAHKVQFRQPIELEQPELDLQEQMWEAKYDVESLPNVATLRFKLGEVEGVKFNRDVNSAAVGKDVECEFLEFPGAQIVARTIVREKKSVEVRISPLFEENTGSKFELTFAKLADLEKRWRQQHTETQATFLTTQGRIRSLTTQRNNIDLSSGDASADARAQVSYNSLGGMIKIASERLPSLAKKIADLERRIAAIPDVEKKMREIAGVRVPFQVVATTPLGDIILIDAMD